MDIKAWMIQNLTNPTILEAGVADGGDTLFFSELFPKGRVFGFEPVESLFYQAVEKTRGRSNVFLEKAALSYIDNTQTIYVSDRLNEPWGSSSLLEPKDHLWFHEQITFKSTEEVKTIALDNWISENNIDKIDLAWLDMQGYEPILLQNSPIALSKINYLYTEVSLIDTYDGVMKYPEYRDWLLSKGFTIIFEDLPYQDMGNVLFKKNI